MESTYLQTVVARLADLRASVTNELIQQAWKRIGSQPIAGLQKKDGLGETLMINGEQVALFYLPRFTGRSLVLDYQILADWVDCSRLPQRHGYQPTGTDQGNQLTERVAENG